MTSPNNNCNEAWLETEIEAGDATGPAAAQVLQSVAQKDGQLEAEPRWFK